MITENIAIIEGKKVTFFKAKRIKNMSILIKECETTIKQIEFIRQTYKDNLEDSIIKYNGIIAKIKND